jgi:hypothetical protein
MPFARSAIRARSLSAPRAKLLWQEGTLGNQNAGTHHQDQNGLFVVLIVATHSEVRVSVRQFSVGHSGQPEVFHYPRELFDELWLNAKDLGLSAYAATDVPDIRASENYVITIGIGNDPKQEMFLVPKCSAPTAITSFVMLTWVPILRSI